MSGRRRRGGLSAEVEILALSIKIDLSDEDLEHFRTLMRQARENSRERTQAEVVQAAHALLDQVQASRAPQFVVDRLGRLTTLIAMLEDGEWALPDAERLRVHTALAYFCEPCDLIPDHVTALGFLDDAIMVELVVEELRHELEAYEDFCRFREEELARRDANSDAQSPADTSSPVTRADWLDAKRAELHGRMRERGLSRGLRGLFSLFSS
jgi:uncharacterized membrane protein YkvA (DUF1232 family)